MGAAPEVGDAAPLGSPPRSSHIPVTPDPWSVPGRLRHVAHDDGRHMIFDPATAESWTVPEETAALVGALQDGWRPGSPTPASWGETAAAMDEQAWESVRTELRAVGLLGLGDDAPAPTAARVDHRGWSDIRIRLFRAHPLPGGLAAPAELLARALPWVLVLACAFGAWTAYSGTFRQLTMLWQGARMAYSDTEIALQGLVVLVVVALVHELGHALTLAALARRPVDVGLRLRYGYPVPFADASAVVALPRRGDRMAVLLGGAAAEAVVWMACVALVVTDRGSTPVALLTVALFGPASLLIQLIPTVRTDGYFAFADLLGERNLVDDAKAALPAFIDPSRMPRAAWLPWFAVLHLATFGAAVVGVVAGLGHALGFPGTGAAVGVLAASAYLVRSATRHSSTVSLP